MLPRISQTQRSRRVGCVRALAPARRSRLAWTPRSIVVLVTTAIASIDQPSESSPAGPETAR